MTARSRKLSLRQAVQPAAPPRLFAIVGADGAPARSNKGHVTAYAYRAIADSEVAGAGRVIEYVPITPAPPRETMWGPGQFDDLKISDDAMVALRITDDGRVRMLISGGDHDITEISSSFGTGLHE